MKETAYRGHIYGWLFRLILALFRRAHAWQGERVSPLSEPTICLSPFLSKRDLLCLSASLPFEVRLIAPARLFSLKSALRTDRRKSGNNASASKRQSLGHAVMTVLLLRSARALPHYSVGILAVKTYRFALRALLQDQPILLLVGEEEGGASADLSRFLGALYAKRRHTPVFLRRLAFTDSGSHAVLSDPLPYPHPYLSYEEIITRILGKNPPCNEKSV